MVGTVGELRDTLPVITARLGRGGVGGTATVIAMGAATGDPQRENASGLSREKTFAAKEAMTVTAVVGTAGIVAASAPPAKVAAGARVGSGISERGLWPDRWAGGPVCLGLGLGFGQRNDEQRGRPLERFIFGACQATWCP